MNWVLHVHRTSRPCVMWIASSAVSVDADSLSIYLSSLDACAPCGCARCGAPPQRVVMCSGGWLMLALGITQYTDRALSRGRSTVRAPWPVHGAVSGGHTYDVNRGVPSTVKNVVSHVSNVRLHARGTEPDTDLGRRGPPVPEIGLSTDHRMLCGEAMS